MESLTGALARFARGSDADAPGARAVLRLSLLDWMTVAIAGQNEPVAGVLQSLAAQEGGAGQAGLIGGGRAPARMAALVNGTVSHALDYDDTHFAHIGHPSVAVMPAVLAVGEHLGASGQEVQAAALIGVEASIRAGLWLGRGHYQVGFHQTATAGAVGAVLAAARLMQLDQAQTEAAVGLVATRASGLKSQFGTMGKPFNAGLAAANGVEAATLIKLGFQPNPQGLEAAQGFGETHHGAGDLAAALDGLGQIWLFEGVSHKFHACCHGLHAALEAAAGIDIAADEIAAIRVETHPRWMSVCNQPAPTTGLGAKFSYATVMAMHYLGHDTAQLASFSGAVCRDPLVQALRDRVAVHAVDDLSEMQTRVEVVLASGEGLRSFHDLDAPLPLAARETRVRGKAAALLGAARAERIWQMIGDAAAPADLAAELAT